MKKILSFSVFLLLSMFIFSQNFELERVEPPFWWKGMKDNSLQLLIYGKNIADTEVEINTKLVDLVKINKAESSNYLFIDLKVKNKTGKFDIIFKKNGKKAANYQYEIKNKTKRQRGFSSKDLIYLAMPDRFANGNPDNDNMPEMLEKVNRKNKDGRHGGDLQGIIDNIDYIKKIGATAIWLNPLLENNSRQYSYHGYGATDFYKIDKRFGTNELYKKFVKKAHKNNIKVIIDVIYNHCGINHWWIDDLPFKNWLNHDKNFNTNYRGSVVADPHSSAYDLEKLTAGWFVSTMPDLNQRNSFLADYFIQNTIWWIEYSGIDGIRIDTYPYPFQNFMSKLCKRIRTEYPDLTLLGETWLQKVPLVAYYQQNNKISQNFNTYLNSVTDFPLFYATKNAFNEKETWTKGLFRIYYILAQDFLYSNPNNLVIFLDNHDLDRYFTSVNEDIDKFKMGIAFLLTTRGIPVVYYGTEIAMSGIEHKGHGHIRKDFPGGWTDDKTNVFEQKNMSKTQTQAFNFFKKIANWRKNNIAVTNGKLKHFIPENNVYVYFRYTNNSAVMVLLNNHQTKTRTIYCSKFNEILKNYNSGFEVITEQKITDLTKIKIKPKTAMIIELYDK